VKPLLHGKITRAVAKIALGLQSELYMGNLDAQRDWGHAKDYVEAMYLILQQEKPSDYVIATGVTTRVRDFIKMAFAEVGFNLSFEGSGVEEVGILDSIDVGLQEEVLQVNGYHVNIGDVLVKVDPAYFRPTEVELLIGDPSKSNKELGWQPKYNLERLVHEMVHADVALFRKDIDLIKSGHKVLLQEE
jgi:GDPmannose 4,6-dehydratase